MKLNRMLRKRRHPAAEFASEHGLLLAGIAGSAALAYAANRLRTKRPQLVDRAMDKTRHLRDRARGLVSRGHESHDHTSDGHNRVEEPAIGHGGSRNRMELSAR